MTIDSNYAPAVFTESRQLSYFAEIEATQSSDFSVYKATASGRTLLTEGFHYYVTLENEDELGGIYKRASITLGAPLAAGAWLEIFRNTTRTTAFDAVERQPFPSGAFEFALDQVCLIQQEMEGHFCACPDYSQYNGTPALPDEQPESVGG